MKNITPMTRYCVALRELKNHLSTFFEPIELTKAAPHQFYDREIDKIVVGKGVDADYILIFKSKVKIDNENLSFAFKFDYINKAPCNQFITPSIESTINPFFKKMSIIGEKLQLQEFNQKLKLFNTSLKDLELVLHKGTALVEQQAKIIKLFETIFMQHAQDFNLLAISNVDNAIQQIEQVITEASVDQLAIDVAQAESKYASARNIVSKAILETEEFATVEYLEKQLKQARSALTTKTKELQIKHGEDKAYLELNNAKQKEKLALGELNKDIKDILIELTSHERVKLMKLINSQYSQIYPYVNHYF